MNPKKLPVYQQKEKILKILEHNNVVIIESPTGSGKTTQIPIILHEAGYANSGIIGITQPRRIAALSVSDFISKQLDLENKKTVGYKMRFEDTTDQTTKIKIMTDGILLQEMKLDPWLSKYSLIMVDEAHERSLNIDFILGLLKRVLAERKDFKVIVSSATINTSLFSKYFDEAPIISIDAIVYPVSVIYDPPNTSLINNSVAMEDLIIEKIISVLDRTITNKTVNDGGILIFLPGERAIKNCIEKIRSQVWAKRLLILPLYGRLSKEEQERVFIEAPSSKIKLVVSTNIAETSITINGITTVIDSGLAKLNFYNTQNYTSSLIEVPVSKASCNQRKGRAGRTQEGTCYRLFNRDDFESRALYTTEEIFRTDLSEVVLRMAELGIKDFHNFDFIASPSKDGILGAIDTLKLLNALESDFTLSKIGEYMCYFPLVPRQSRIIVEALLSYPQVIEEVIIASSFLSAQSPFILPEGKEMDARKAHHAFRDPLGDFVSYLKIYRMYNMAKDKEKFCTINYFDERILAEISNIKDQLELIVSEMGFPISSGGTSDDYLTCIATGMIQFVCTFEGKGFYQSKTANRIQIHPSSSIFREQPQFIVAGEIVRTSRMYAMSVSPLTKEIISKISNYTISKNIKSKSKTQKIEKDNQKIETKKEKALKQKKETTDIVSFGNESFNIIKVKGKKELQLPLESFLRALKNVDLLSSHMKQINGIRGKVIIDTYEILNGEKMELIISVASIFGFNIVKEKNWPRNETFNYYESPKLLIKNISYLFKLAIAKQKSKQLGFICLFTDGKGQYWFKVSRGIHTALHETLTSLETLIDESNIDLDESDLIVLNSMYRKVNSLMR